MNECCDVQRSSFRIIVPIFPAPRSIPFSGSCPMMKWIHYPRWALLPTVSTHLMNVRAQMPVTAAWVKTPLKSHLISRILHVIGWVFCWHYLKIEFIFRPILLFFTWLKVLFLKILPNKPLVSQFLTYSLLSRNCLWQTSIFTSSTI